jgi:hypothetical protein
MVVKRWSSNEVFCPAKSNAPDPKRDGLDKHNLRRPTHSMGWMEFDGCLHMQHCNCPQFYSWLLIPS